MACELVTLSDERVKCFGDSVVYLICGKVICVKTKWYDITNPEDITDIIEFAERLYGPESLVGRTYGEKSICLLDDDCNGNMFVSVYSVDMLRDPEIRTAARKAFGLDHA